MGIAYESVRIQVVGTAHVGYTEGTYGSRTTFGTGWAVYELGRKITAEMCERAAELWGVAAEDVRAEGGMFYGPDGKAESFAEVAAQLTKPLTASASVFPSGIWARVLPPTLSTWKWTWRPAR